jgi:hypothetical protein
VGFVSFEDKLTQLVENQMDVEETIVMNRGSKGKQKENEAEGKGSEWTLVGGVGRCTRCLTDDGKCRINLGAIEKWRKDVEAGKMFARHPTDTNCARCTEKRKACVLPATERMRMQLTTGLAPRMAKKRSGRSGVSHSASPLVASSSKRRLEELEEILPRKRTRTAKAGGSGTGGKEMTDDEFCQELLRVLTGFAESADSMAQTGEEAHKTLDLLMRWVAKSHTGAAGSLREARADRVAPRGVGEGVEGRKAEKGGRRVVGVGRGVGSRDPDNRCVEEG